MPVNFRRGEGRRPGLSRRRLCARCVELCVEFLPGGGARLSRRLLCARCVELCVEFLPGGGASLRRSSGEGRAVDHSFAVAATHTFAGLAGIAGLAG